MQRTATENRCSGKRSSVALKPLHPPPVTYRLEILVRFVHKAERVVDGVTIVQDTACQHEIDEVRPPHRHVVEVSVPSQKIFNGAQETALPDTVGVP